MQPRTDSQAEGCLNYVARRFAKVSGPRDWRPGGYGADSRLPEPEGGGGRPLVLSRRHDVPLHNVILIIIGAHLCSVGDLDLVGSEPFWSDPDPINRPDPTIKSHKTRKKSKNLNSVDTE